MEKAVDVLAGLKSESSSSSKLKKTVTFAQPIAAVHPVSSTLSPRPISVVPPFSFTSAPQLVHNPVVRPFHRFQADDYSIIELKRMVLDYAWDASLDGGEVLYKAANAPYQMCRRSALTLCNDQDLDTDVVDCYVDHLNWNSVISNQVKRWIFSDSFSQLVSADLLSTPPEASEFSRVIEQMISESWAKDLDFSAVDHWFFPFCSHGHYVLFAVNNDRRRFEYFDTKNHDTFELLHTDLGEKLVYYVVAFTRLKHPHRKNQLVDFSKYKWEVQKKVVQRDQHACGVYLLNFCEHWKGKYKSYMSSVWKLPDVLAEYRREFLCKLVLSPRNTLKQSVLSSAIFHYNKPTNK